MKTKNAPAKTTSSSALGIWPGTLFEDFFKGWPNGTLAAFENDTEFFPDMDLVEKKKEYRIKLDVPGMSEDNLSIEVNNRLLTVSGRSEEKVLDPEDKEIVRERRVTSFSRSFTLPEDVNTAKIDANYRKGVLEITMAKAKEAVANTRKIDIK